MPSMRYLRLDTLAIMALGCTVAHAAAPTPHQGEVTLTAAEIKAESITTTTMQPEPFTPSRRAFARVLSINPLIALRERLAKAEADATAAQANSAALTSHYNRDLKLFNAHQAISAQTLQDGRAASASADAVVASTTARIEMIKATLLQQYGAPLAANAPVIQALQNGTDRLVSVVLPADFIGAAPAAISLVVPVGSAVAAHLIGPASTVDPVVSGRPFYYVTQAPLPAGLATGARLPLASSRPALLIPPRAVLWYAAERWAYVELKPGLFQRRLIAAKAIEGQYPAGEAFKTGDNLVTSGAQLLLSQELLPRAIATSCKDPPECDD